MTRHTGWVCHSTPSRSSSSPHPTPLLHRTLPPRRYSRLLSNLGPRLLDTYSEVVGASPDVDRLLRALRDRLAEELGVQAALSQLAGALEPLLAVSLALTASAGQGRDSAGPQ